MADLRFEWDPGKDLANQRKHAVSFEEASTVFADEHALLISDPGHSRTEDRFILLGLSGELRALVVCHCYRGGDIVRIISERPATRAERGRYSKGWLG